ncbi:MAG: HNH endonuclease [Candidatus Babeliales bacterium]
MKNPVSRKKISFSKLGKKNPNWKGGVHIKADGYRLVRSLGHPYADRQGYVAEHRLVMERHLGRFLSPGEIVHHINGIPDDNRYANLLLFSGQKEHLRHHHLLSPGKLIPMRKAKG